jgi:predicted alpha-1,2-mannosidase
MQFSLSVFHKPFTILTAWLLFFITAGYAQEKATLFQPEELVNPLMGTESTPDLSTGNTYPAIALPWGMNFWMPQTGKMGDGWAYTYNARKIRGFKQTHQPSPWINDYGQFSIMPVTGKLRFNEDERASWFSHKTEAAKPFYYSVYLAEHDVTAEITPTERAAVMRFTFPQTDSAFIVVDAFDKGSYVRIIPEKNMIVGYTTKNSGGVPSNFKNYFVIKFNTAFGYTSTWSGRKLTNQNEVSADHAGGVVGFKTRRGEKIELCVASSFISEAQAMQNLLEAEGSTFEAITGRAKSAWNAELSRIVVEGGTDQQVRTFYSCLYRVLLFPRKFYEVDSNGSIVHYSPYNGKVLPGYMFTDNGFWDTFRAVFPFFNLMYPSLNSKIMEGLVNTYKESGWLPEWASPGHRDCMIGSNSASIIADAYIKGVRGFDVNVLYEAMMKNAGSEGPLSSVGRKGVMYYNALGYIPYDVGINENTARTLEYAYDDFAALQLARKLQRPQKEIDQLTRRCQNYRNVFDPSTKLMRGRNKDGSFQTPFNPFKWGDAFTEGNSWHYTWSVFHDPKGLIDLMGGNENFVRMLDSVFVTPPVFDESYYGFVIHEIREMQIMGLGNYAHGNQPIQHMPYLYNYAGQPWKTQHWVREVMDKLYSPTPDGYCGDEDNGQTSAWYVFSALGFYPVCPATTQYVLGSPLFSKATLHLENGKEFVISAPENSPEKRFVHKMLLNGQEYTRLWLDHDQIQQGGQLGLSMKQLPDKERSIGKADLPYSISDEIVKGAKKHSHKTRKD